MCRILICRIKVLIHLDFEADLIVIQVFLCAKNDEISLWFNVLDQN